MKTKATMSGVIQAMLLQQNIDGRKRDVVIIDQETWDQLKDEYRSMGKWAADIVGTKILDHDILIDPTPNRRRCETRYLR